ncbi:MAG: 30S ribosomal protein S11 [Candidatus Campbellbacteria bacterium]|nr:30S ribosomal protein S11 [Candidatus Campbellbacteria bacterium]
MGKKRIITKSGEGGKRVQAKAAKRRVAEGKLYIHSSYNNTKLLLTDKEGGALVWSTAGALGFSGARKATPYAAAKVGELLAESAENMGMKEVDIVVKGVGAGRESSIRSFASKGVKIGSIKDDTPIPHGGPRPPRPRRV